MTASRDGVIPWARLACLLAAYAVSAVATESTPLDQIIVTARRQPEPLSEVPLAVTVLTDAGLYRAGIAGMQSLAEEVPGLYFESMWGGSNAAPTLRGQAQPNQGGNNVGVFVDGVYQANNAGLDTSLLDLERVEVIKGPQSSLYGRSTFSGVINYITHRPRDRPEAQAEVQGGTQHFMAVSAALSSPVGASGLSLRAAGSLQNFDGTGVNVADPLSNLGGYRKRALSLAASLQPSGWDILATLRYSDDELAQPAASSLTAADYNCGSRNPQSGLWTYFCGNAPRTDRYDLSPAIPGSTTRTLQGALQVRRDTGPLSLQSLTTYYRGVSEIYQDFDVSSVGRLYGICTQGINCDSAPGTFANLTRTVNVNEVMLDHTRVEELSEELRLHYARGALQATLGGLVAVNRSLIATDIGASPAAPLSNNELLTEILPASPAAVGPASIINDFLVADANRQQLNFSPSVITHQHFNDVFGVLDWALNARLNAHAEVRAGLFGSTSATTKRLSLDYRADSASLIWVSAAEGQNPGGSNNDATLLPEEQNYGPESNWTYEIGFRGPLYPGLINVDGTLFYIDWRQSQIVGPSNSSGDHGFITRNVSGVTTAGAEVSAQITLPAHLNLLLDYAYNGAHFKQGSEDVGGRKFCGLEDGATTSNFCRIGPSRSVPAGAGPLVPYVDGNVLLRSPEQQWTAALQYEGGLADNRVRGFARVGVSHQGSVYFRSIDGASNGARTLLNARLGVSNQVWSVELWASNLTNVTYIRGVSSRGPRFFPVSPRPHDLLYGDGRRINLGVAFHYR